MNSIFFTLHIFQRFSSNLLQVDRGANSMIKFLNFPIIILTFMFSSLGDFELTRFQQSKHFSDQTMKKLLQCVSLSCALWTLTIAKASIYRKDSPAYTPLFYVCCFLLFLFLSLLFWMLWYSCLNIIFYCCTLIFHSNITL